MELLLLLFQPTVMKPFGAAPPQKKIPFLEREKSRIKEVSRLFHCFIL
jgi:hypothetical protein